MSQQTIEMLTTQLHVLERKFHRACRQVLILNNKIIELLERYNRAQEVDRESFRYSLDLQLTTTVAVKDMYHEYACRRSDEMDAIQDYLVIVGVLPDYEEEMDWDVDEWTLLQ